MAVSTRTLASLGVLAANVDRNLRASISDLVSDDRVALSLRPEIAATDPERAITASIDARSLDATALIGRLRRAYNVAGRRGSGTEWTESLILFVPPHLRQAGNDLPSLFTVDVRLAD